MSATLASPPSVPAPIRADAEVLENRAEGPGSYRLVLRVEAWPGFEPGQFLMLTPGARTRATRTDPLLPRPMAVYRAEARAEGAAVEVLYKVTGRGTTLLSEALPGQEVGIVGPLGRPFPEPEAGEEAVLVAGGTGIASVYELARRLGGRTLTRVLLGARAADDLMGREDFEALGAELIVATEDGSAGKTGLVTDLLAPLLTPEARLRVYACGPTPMMRRAAELAAAAGRPCLVSLENHMACGFGVCLGCAAPLAAGGFGLVCSQGPVFDAAAIDWDGLP